MAGASLPVRSTTSRPSRRRRRDDQGCRQEDCRRARDDLALNAEQVSGVRAERELPVVWAVAKGCS